MTAIDAADLTLRLFMDVICVAVLAVLAGRRRPRRGLFVVFTVFNIVLFAVLTVITQRHIGPAVGFGLFALLSIVRLRSEPFSNQELSYFFAALGLALINGVRIAGYWVPLGLDVLVLGALLLVDHPGLVIRSARVRVTLDEILTDPAELQRVVAQRLGRDVLEVNVLEVDYVRETMRLVARTAQPAGVAEPAGDLLDLDGASA